MYVLWLGLLALFWCFLWWFCVEVELLVKWTIEIPIKGQKEQLFDKLILLKGFSWPRQKNHWPGAWVSSEYNWSDWQAGKETKKQISIYNQMVREGNTVF